MAYTLHSCCDILGAIAFSWIRDADTFLAAAVARLLFGRGSLGLPQRPVTLFLVVPHGKEGDNDCDPVKIIREDRSNSRRAIGWLVKKILIVQYK